MNLWHPGIPFISSNVGGISELYNKDVGILVKPGDVDNLSKKWSGYLETIMIMILRQLENTQLIFIQKKSLVKSLMIYIFRYNFYL